MNMYVYTVMVDPRDGRDVFIGNIYPYTPASRLSITHDVEAYEKAGCRVIVYQEELRPEGRKTMRKVYPVMEPTYEW